MASNEIPENVNDLISLAVNAAEGARKEGAAIQLAQNTEAKILADLEVFVGNPGAAPPVPGAQNLYNAAKSVKVAATASRRAAENTAKAFCTRSVGVLKNYLGQQWNAAWQAAGFTAGSLEIPDDPMSLVTEIRAYFLTHPAQENAPLTATAAEAQNQIAAVTVARAQSNDRVRALGEAKAASDAARRALSRRLSGLRTELMQLLESDDPRWYAFGFDRPADGWQPGPVEHLILTPGGSGSVFADWDDSRRAERYRVTRQAGSGPVEVAHPGVLESEYTLTGLTPGSTVVVTVTALNAAGEGAVSATGSVVVP